MLQAQKKHAKPYRVNNDQKEFLTDTYIYINNIIVINRAGKNITNKMHYWLETSN